MTALYELELLGGEPVIGELRIRHKPPGETSSEEHCYSVRDLGYTLGQAGDDFRFAAAVAEFGMILSESEHRGQASLEQVLELASTSREGYRAEFLRLVRRTQELSRTAG